MALTCPSAMVIVAGTVTFAVLLLANVKTKPPTGAGSDKVIGIERVNPGAIKAAGGKLIEVGRTVTLAVPETNSVACA